MPLKYLPEAFMIIKTSLNDMVNDSDDSIKLMKTRKFSIYYYFLKNMNNNSTISIIIIIVNNLRI